MTTTPAPRPVPSPEDRMRDARTDTGPIHPAVQRVLAEHAHHIQPRDPNRPAPTFATYLDRTERDQLDARAATAEQERDDALDDRDAYKEARDVLRKQLDQVQQRNRDLTDLLRQKRDTISALAAELGDAHDLIAEIRNNRANDDRAFARWETRQPGQPCSPPCTPALGSLPPRAQDDRPHPGLHVTRGTGPSDLESTCPCPKEPCGAVDTRRTNPDCEQHPGNRAKTMRQMHRADQCPAEREG